MAGEELVQRIDQARRARRFDQTHDGAGQTCLGEKRHSSATVAWNRCAVAKHEPPTLSAVFLGDGRKELARFVLDDARGGPMAGQIVPFAIPADDTATGREFWARGCARFSRAATTTELTSAPHDATVARQAISTRGVPSCGISSRQ